MSFHQRLSVTAVLVSFVWAALPAAAGPSPAETVHLSVTEWREAGDWAAIEAALKPALIRACHRATRSDVVGRDALMADCLRESLSQVRAQIDPDRHGNERLAHMLR